MHQPLRNDLARREADFAANRAVGSVLFQARHINGAARRGEVHEAGSLRVRFPSPDTDALSAVLINTAGGIAGGDRFSVAITAEAQASVTVTTAAAEKVYRSHGPAAQVNVTLRAAEGARLAWLPQETILFDESALSRRIDMELAEHTALVCAEIVVFGRTAMDERLRRGQLVDRWRLTIGGRLVFAETVRLGEEIAAMLDRPAIARGGVAVATVLIAPGDEALVERLREGASAFSSEAGISAWNGFALARFCGRDAARLRADVMALLKAIDPVMLPRLWLN